MRYGRRGCAVRSKKWAAPLLAPSGPPYRAVFGDWESPLAEDLFEAIDIGRALGIGAKVVNASGTVIVKWVRPT